jgi:LuxR family maltose regulon positive regulatory protein
MSGIGERYSAYAGGAFSGVSSTGGVRSSRAIVRRSVAAAISTGFVPRPALVELLERGAQGPVTVVAASAGSGKTLLVRAWLRGSEPQRRAAWVSVERGEHDAQHFWAAVVGELSRAAPEGITIEALTPTPAFNAHAVLERLRFDLKVAAVPWTLVIDDLHELAAADAREQLTDFLDHLPDNVHVVLISRRDLPLGLHRRRLAGELTEIRSADLRFTLPETRTMLAALGIELSAAGLAQLHDRTEGWVAGLRLAMMSLAAHPDPEGFVAEFSGSERTVAEYLLAEVLEGQAPDVRRLLTRTSILSRINGPLATLLTGDAGAEHSLQALADTGGFVVALDASRTWFRFHHLFADLLAVELRHTEPTEIPGLHRRAATWYAQHGDVVEAIAHAQAAGDARQAAGWLIGHYFSLTLDGRGATARTLLERLDQELLGDSPELATVLAAEQLVSGSLEAATGQLALAERHLARVPDDRRHRLEMALLVTRLSLARRLGDFRSVVDEVSPAVAVVEPESGVDIGIHNDVRTLILMNLGIVEVWSGRFDQGERHLEEARDLAHRIGRPYLEVDCEAHLAHVASWRSFTRGREASAQVTEAARRHGWEEDPVIGPALLTLGTCLLQAGRFSEAEHWLARAAQTVRPELEPAIGVQLYLGRGGLELALGRDREALENFRNADRLGLLLISDSPLSRQLRSSKLRTMLAVGESSAVREALAELSEHERDAGEVREVIAALALADGDPDTALTELAPTLSGATEVHNVVVVVRSLLLAALAHDALEQTSEREQAVEQALELAETDMLILPFAHLSARELLERHPRHRTAHGALIAQILDVLSGRSPPPESGPVAPAREPLSDAELRVLRYLPTNLSAGDIAGQLYISVHTVKSHMRHIYAKLDAHTRTAAVGRARALGLLGHDRSRA